MITLSNGHSFQYMVAAGALRYDGKGWPWEWHHRWMGNLKPELFTVVTKTLTYKPVAGNICWLNPLTYLPFSPWSCVRYLPGGVINKVALTNPGIEWWCCKIGPKANSKKIPLVVSIDGTAEELPIMTPKLDSFDIVGVELNASCPNTGKGIENTEEVVRRAQIVRAYSKHPLIAKISAAQDYIAIARRLRGIVQAISLNSVPYELVFPGDTTYEFNPLRRLIKKLAKGKPIEHKVGTGGGVSGKLAQAHNWKAVDEIADLGTMHVIAPSIMEYDDLAKVDFLGAAAYSFGAIHLEDPCKATKIVERHMTKGSHDDIDLSMPSFIEQ